MAKQFKVKKQVVTALDNVSLSVREGEFLCIVGPSGCGKTTLLRIIAGLEEPSSGTMTIQHKNPSQPLNSMVFQEHAVFPWMTVRKNIAYGLNMRKVPKEVVQEVVDQYIRKVGLTKFADAYPHQLSGGMKQRISVARAFANDPEILLMDEPFAALDEQNRLTLQQELVRIWEETRKTVVFITHSIDEAIFLGDRIVLMTAHPGRIRSAFEVDLPRPRRMEDVRSHPRFQELFFEIWGQMKEEVQRSRQLEGLGSEV
ncbi:MAG: ABC transporter ATP-binding protein [Alicyclobacillus sp.]|nr:ABC transporter ATP-binding protein [Alicyclobacillus sp.]